MAALLAALIVFAPHLIHKTQTAAAITEFEQLVVLDNSRAVFNVREQEALYVGLRRDMVDPLSIQVRSLQKIKGARSAAK